PIDGVKTTTTSSRVTASRISMCGIELVIPLFAHGVLVLVISEEVPWSRGTTISTQSHANRNRVRVEGFTVGGDVDRETDVRQAVNRDINGTGVGGHLEFREFAQVFLVQRRTEVRRKLPPFFPVEGVLMFGV